MARLERTPIFVPPAQFSVPAPKIVTLSEPPYRSSKAQPSSQLLERQAFLMVEASASAHGPPLAIDRSGGFRSGHSSTPSECAPRETQGMTTTPATTDASLGTTMPAAMATPTGLWKRGGAAIAMLAVGTLTLFAVERPTPAPHSPKLDRALVAWTTGDNSGPVRVIIQTKPGAASIVMQRLRATAASVRVSSAPDLLIADLSLEALTRAAADHDVVRLSGDVPVVGMESRRSTTTNSTRQTDNRAGWGPVKVLNIAAISLSSDNHETR